MLIKHRTWSVRIVKGSSKGNFILSGKHIPKARPRENLLSMVIDMVYRKYLVIESSSLCTAGWQAGAMSS